MGKRKVIGIFAVEASSRVQCSLYKELQEKAKELGYNIVLFTGNYDGTEQNRTAEASRSLFALAKYMDLAGMIIHAQSIGEEDMIRDIIKLGKEKHIPIFAYDCEAVGIKKEEGVIPITLDYKQGFAESVKHVIEHHHCKNVFMLAGIKNNKYSDDRVEMYRKEMAAHGLEVREGMVGYGDFWEIPAIAAVNQFLDSDLPRPDAICCANDSMAIVAAKVLKERGLRVPEDVLVTGFDGIDDGKYNLPAIATCEPCLDVASEFIFDVIEGNKIVDELMVPLHFYPKESCGCTYSDTLEDRKEIARMIENNRQNSWQSHMLATMQFELIDSSEPSDSVGYMQGILNLFDGYSHVFCIRENLEFVDDYKDPFGKMRVHLNNGFLRDESRGVFDVQEIAPDFDEIIEEENDYNLFIFRMIHCADKKYGYTISRTNRCNANEIKLQNQFVECITNIIEGMLRNRRLLIANQKLNEMYERMAEIHIRDTMTGLYNRNGYYQVLGEYLEKEELKTGYLHIIAIDMDNMKPINDHYGHLEGDIAIQAVARAIDDCLKYPCVCARFGGDEFEAAIFTGAPEEPTAEKIAWKINHYLKDTELLAGKEYVVEVSAGKAVIKISDLVDLKSVEKMADDAMYEHKRKRKNGEV